MSLWRSGTVTWKHNQVECKTAEPEQVPSGRRQILNSLERQGEDIHFNGKQRHQGIENTGGNDRASCICKGFYW